MRSLGVSLSVLVFAVVAGCSEGQDAPQQPAAASAPTSASPKAEKTYVPAVGDPISHELNVTIRDEPPLDAYEAASATGCRAIVWGPDSEQLGELVVSAPDGEYEWAVFETFDIPAEALLTPEDTCQATMTVTVPYAPRYRLGLGIIGRGIAPDDAPRSPDVVTRGNSQEVVVVK